MGFDVAASAYDRFMGRYSAQLAAPMADLAGVAPGNRALDVGCGPGALTAELVARLGPDAVTAADPSASFVAAARERLPGVEVVEAPAEELPFADGAFDAALAQLVVHFMADPVAGLGEMLRVTRPGGSVVACVWDLAGGRAPLSAFWKAVRSLEVVMRDESGRPGTGDGDLVALLEAAGAHDVTQHELSVVMHHETFDDWWEPYELGVGPAGEQVARMPQERRAALRERCREVLPAAPFTLESVAWAARGLAPDAP